MIQDQKEEIRSNEGRLTIERFYMPAEQHYAANVTFVLHVQEHYVSGIQKSKQSIHDITLEYCN